MEGAAPARHLVRCSPPRAGMLILLPTMDRPANSANGFRRAVIPCLAAAFVSAALAAEVQVVDPDGHAKQDVVVLCDGRSKGATITDATGTVAVADTCRRVQCVHGEFLMGEVTVEGGHALCRLGAGVHVSGEIDRKACGECSVSLIGYGSGRASESGRVDLPKDGRPATFQLQPVPPGPYTLMVSRHGDGWNCSTDLGELSAGLHTVAAIWREPTRVEVKVVGQDGKPAAGLPVRLVPTETLTDVPEGGRCSYGWYRGDLLTDVKGEVRILTDRSDPSAVVEAGDPDDAGHFASVSLSRKRSGKLVITLPAGP